MGDTVYKKFVNRWLEVTELPPQSLGPFTPAYKSVVRHLKVMPWPALVATSVAVVVLLYVVLGSTVVFLVSLLQRGF